MQHAEISLTDINQRIETAQYKIKEAVEMLRHVSDLLETYPSKPRSKLGVVTTCSMCGKPFAVTDGRYHTCRDCTECHELRM
jgi:hypothetical protein